MFYQLIKNFLNGALEKMEFNSSEVIFKCQNCGHFYHDEIIAVDDQDNLVCPACESASVLQVDEHFVQCDCGEYAPQSGWSEDEETPMIFKCSCGLEHTGRVIYSELGSNINKDSGEGEQTYGRVRLRQDE